MNTYTDDQIQTAIDGDNLARGLAATGSPGLARERAIRVLDGADAMSPTGRAVTHRDRP